MFFVFSCFALITSTVSANPIGTYFAWSCEHHRFIHTQGHICVSLYIYNYTNRLKVMAALALQMDRELCLDAPNIM